MPKLVKDEGDYRVFEMEDGSKVKLQRDDDEFAIVATDLKTGNRIGTLEFSEIEAGDHHTPDYWKLVYAYLDKAGDRYKRSGLGREALKLWILSYGPAAVERDTGIPNSQGSHLTGDAPGFVAKMVEEKLLYYER
ncbi:hypothetical protein [Bradyrhizobium brasilense]|nr:hypothetical protein [Bradyrhizobium brasilense]